MGKEKSNNIRKIELLAPAKNKEIAIEAIKHGADAVYIGPSKFGARAAAGNSLEDLADIVEFAHTFDAKVYCTVNTILYDEELKDAERLVKDLYRIGIDALIVQDMSLLRLDLPPIQLHASTQCDTRTVAKAKFLEEVGFSQIVLARELTNQEIGEICDAVNVPIECFIHGALCVSYSGKCNASYSFKNRSANRGECAQICRLPYNLYDSNGNVVMKDKHILSLKDFNQSDNIENLLNCGVQSLKIEGRLKDIEYVKNVTAYYNNLLNTICEDHPEKFRRSSYGNVDLRFTPQIEKSFNRGFTHYFFDVRRPQISMASIHTPKSQGEYIGKVKFADRNNVFINTNKQITNGDGLVYFNNDCILTGFRANKVEGNKISTLDKVSIPKGTSIYRNSDKAFSDLLSKDTAERKLGINIELNKTLNGIATKITDEKGNSATVNTHLEHEKAKADQTANRERQFGKLGNTNYYLQSLNCNDTTDLFIPNSILSDIKREAIVAISRANKIAYKFEYRKEENKDAQFPKTELAFNDNVANKISKQFYESHDVTTIAPAMEVAGANDDDILMTTRYCIRRELGCCLRETKKDVVGKNPYIVSGNVKMQIQFDCKNCQMILRKYKD